MKGSEKDTLMFISSNNASFVRQDVEALGRYYNVIQFEFGSRKGLKMVEFQFRLLLWVLQNAGSAKAVLIWFADYHSFLPTLFSRLFGTRTYLIIGGYDAASLPEYNYGGHNSRLRSWMITKSCRWATGLLPVSNFVNSELSKRIGTDEGDKRTIVYNGIDISVFSNEEVVDEGRSGIICVSLADSMNRAKVKGVDLLLEVAKLIPQEQFTLVGIGEQLRHELQSYAVANVAILEKVDRDKLGVLYRKARVVCQLSRFESFGMSLAEGMLNGCVPVSVPDIGPSEILDAECGFVSASYKIEDIRDALEMALRTDGSFRIKARQRIVEHFDLETRTRNLRHILNPEESFQETLDGPLSNLVDPESAAK